MATHRRPLGESRLSNHGAVIVKSRTELQVKATKSFVDHSSEVEASKKDLERAKGKLARRDATIQQLSKGGNQDEDLASQLEDLVKRYQESKSKYTDEIASLRAENHKAHQELRSYQKIEKGDTVLRAAHRSIEAENVRLKSELATRPPDGEVERLEEDNERLQEQVERMTEAYARLYERRSEEKEDKVAEMRTRWMDELSRGDLLTRRLEDVRNQLQDTQRQLSMVRHDRLMVEEIVQELLDERQLDREIPSAHSSAPIPLISPLDTDSSEILQLLDLSLNHSSLLSADRQTTLDSLSTLQTQVFTRTSDLSQTRTALTSLQRSHSDLQDVASTHNHCAVEMKQLRINLVTASQGEIYAKKLLDDLRGEMGDVEESAAKDREELKRVEEGLRRGGVARVGLEGEILRLRESLISANQYQSLHTSLQTQNSISLSQIASLKSQLEDLTRDNGELMAGGEGSRISYVEGVRREMAAVKQELATTRTLLNAANQRIRGLEEECDAYKAVDDLQAGAGQRTRVVRREPEGGLVISGRRSVSTSTRRA